VARRRRRRSLKRPSIRTVFQTSPSPAWENFRKVAIVPAKDEAETVGAVVKALLGVPVDEVLVVANGCTDDTAKVAAAAGARVLEIAETLGHDVGRAVGASVVDADIYLFTDADIVLPPPYFIPFINAVSQGVDVALNDLDAIATPRSRLHIVNICKKFLNTAIGLEQLGINSLTAIPHALSRRAVRAIGAQNLAVPPRAMVLAHKAGLVMEGVASVNVNTLNRVRPWIHPPGLGPMDELIIGDHLEALAEIVKADGPRARFRDVNRVRGRSLQRAIVETARL
jgi:Glycosyltransferases involved in cell wall biogenesis